MKKAQAALEFLTTYGWAFLTIVITISALYYFGVFDFGKFLPQKCTFPPQFRCIDFSVIYDTKDDTREIKFMLLNDVGEDIEVTSLEITNDANPSLSCTLPTTPFPWSDDEEKNFIFTSCSGGDFIKGERIEAKITFNYYATKTTSKPSHQVKGKIVSKVQ